MYAKTEVQHNGYGKDFTETETVGGKDGERIKATVTTLENKLSKTAEEEAGSRGITARSCQINRINWLLHCHRTFVFPQECFRSTVLVSHYMKTINAQEMAVKKASSFSVP